MKICEKEIRECYGDTAAYAEYTEKTKNYTDEKWSEANDGLMGIFAEFAVSMNSGSDPGSAEAQEIVAKLQRHITSNYYTCSCEILAGLGQMYICDERFRENIDKYGDGTANFASEAIGIFCKVK